MMQLLIMRALRPWVPSWLQMLAPHRSVPRESMPQSSVPIVQPLQVLPRKAPPLREVHHERGQMRARPSWKLAPGRKPSGSSMGVSEPTGREGGEEAGRIAIGAAPGRPRIRMPAAAASARAEAAPASAGGCANPNPTMRRADISESSGHDAQCGSLELFWAAGPAEGCGNSPDDRPRPVGLAAAAAAGGTWDGPGTSSGRAAGRNRRSVLELLPHSSVRSSPIVARCPSPSDPERNSEPRGVPTCRRRSDPPGRQHSWECPVSMWGRTSCPRTS